MLAVKVPLQTDKWLEAAVKEVWVMPVCYHQPSIEELSSLLKVLMQVCQDSLIPDIIKVVHSYLIAHVERFHVGMLIDLLDKRSTNNFRWRVARIKRIGSIGEKVLFYTQYIGWNSDSNEWVTPTSDRIQLLHNKRKEIVRDWEPFRPRIGDWIDWHNPITREWYQRQVQCVLNTYRGMPYIRLTNLANAYRDFECDCLDFAPCGTF